MGNIDVIALLLTIIAIFIAIFVFRRFLIFIALLIVIAVIVYLYIEANPHTKSIFNSKSSRTEHMVPVANQRTGPSSNTINVLPRTGPVNSGKQTGSGVSSNVTEQQTGGVERQSTEQLSKLDKFKYNYCGVMVDHDDSLMCELIIMPIYNDLAKHYTIAQLKAMNKTQFINAVIQSAKREKHTIVTNLMNNNAFYLWNKFINDLKHEAIY